MYEQEQVSALLCGQCVVCPGEGFALLSGGLGGLHNGAPPAFLPTAPCQHLSSVPATSQRPRGPWDMQGQVVGRGELCLEAVSCGVLRPREKAEHQGARTRGRGGQQGAPGEAPSPQASPALRGLGATRARGRVARSGAATGPHGLSGLENDPPQFRGVSCEVGETRK